MNIDLVTLVVHDYDTAIAFFVETLDFTLVEDAPAVTDDGQPKRWVVVRPPGSLTGLLLAQADGDRQTAVVGNQTGGRGRFLPPRGRLRRYLRSHDSLRRVVHETASNGALRSGRSVRGPQWATAGTFSGRRRDPSTRPCVAARWPRTPIGLSGAPRRVAKRYRGRTMKSTSQKRSPCGTPFTSERGPRVGLLLHSLILIMVVAITRIAHFVET
jgi:catechol 2,3-dioxygenase-like lactoylglutathione lyase family enzyme